MDWYDGAEGLLHPRVPTLCIALEGGTVQIGRGVDDPSPVIINAHMTIRQVGKSTSPERWEIAAFLTGYGVPVIFLFYCFRIEGLRWLCAGSRVSPMESFIDNFPRNTTTALQKKTALFFIEWRLDYTLRQNSRDSSPSMIAAG